MTNSVAVHAWRPRARTLLLGLGLGLAAMSGAPNTVQAQSEPPIQSAEDAACREVARSRVYSAPDPENLGLREVGKRIYMACMKQSKVKARGPVKRRAKSKRRRR